MWAGREGRKRHVGEALILWLCRVADQVQATLGGTAAARDAAGFCTRLAALDKTPSEVPPRSLQWTMVPNALHGRCMGVIDRA